MEPNEKNIKSNEDNENNKHPLEPGISAIFTYVDNSDKEETTE